MLSVPQVAAYFLCRQDLEAGDPITHLKLQKLVYYAQAWSLALRLEPLFDEDFEAWVHGPALMSLYTYYADHGWNPLPIPQDFDSSSIDEEVRSFLDEVWQVYGGYSAKKLEQLTHSEQPWIEARKGCGPLDKSREIIRKESMQAYYRGLYEKDAEGAQ